jgi:hypothetical protein
MLQTDRFPLSKTAPIIWPEYSGLSGKAILELLRPHSDRLLDRWIQSGRTDYEIYKDPSYIQEGFLSFYKVSHMCLGQLKIWFAKTDMELGGKTLFTLYPGVGINLLTLTQLGCNIIAHNDNPAQVETMFKLFDAFKLKRPTIIGEEWRKKKFDFVEALEVIEHYDRPIEITTDLMKCVKHEGYLIESTGFKQADYPGHHEIYFIDEQPVSGMKCTSIVSKAIKAGGFIKVLDGFNRKPRVWQNVGIGSNVKSPTLRELHGAEWDKYYDADGKIVRAKDRK